MKFTQSLAALLCCLAGSLAPAQAANNISTGAVTFDRPTLTSIGIRLALTGDDNYNATVGVRYRKTGTSAWTQGLPLFRIRPANVSAVVPTSPQFTGSLLDLRPASQYEFELQVIDPDGGSSTVRGNATTRAIPAGPQTPRNVSVNSTSGLVYALIGARPGDIITLADGVYSGPFNLTTSGTANNPIVIRGTSRDNSIIDGGNCIPCNIFDIYASYVHVERLTLRNGQRAIRWQTNGATGNVLRKVRIANTDMATSGKPGQTDFYIADNIMVGRVPWPVNYVSDSGAASNNDGIYLSGDGHVVSHNQISGYSDMMKNSIRGWKSCDFYNNDILWSYDNAVELDYGGGNLRFARNRMTNTFMPISIQPGYLGPFYIYRNVSVNSISEQLKIHTIASETPRPMNNGIFVFHNTFVSPTIAMLMQGDNRTNTLAVQNNLFIGAPNFFTFNWYANVTEATFDYNGYFPDGFFTLGTAPKQNGANLAAFQKLGRETHGRIMTGQVFESGLTPGTTYVNKIAPQNVTLNSGSNAIDAGVVIPGISSTFMGSAPDMGALERGCALPIYGPRPDGIDESNEDFGCNSTLPEPLPAPVASSIVTVSGTPQTTQISTGFTAPLVVSVKDDDGVSMPNVTVTFTVPASGASALFGGTPTASVVTNASGIAAAPALTANATAGNYAVTAVAASLPLVSFALTNTTPSPVPVITVQPRSGVYNPGGIATNFSASVLLPSGPVNGGQISFSIDGSPVIAGALLNGQVSVNYTVPPAQSQAGTHTITASYPGSGNTGAASGTATFTITKATPDLNWSAFAPTALGTALSAAHYNVVSNVPGIFTYSPAIGTPVNTSQTTLTTTFTPSDTTNYNPRVLSAVLTTLAQTTVIVRPAFTTYDLRGVWTPFFATVTSPSGEPVLNGTATFLLDGVALGSNLVRNGQTAMNFSTSAVAGAHTLTVQFNGFDTIPASSGSALLTVAKGTPSLPWPAVAPVAAGTTLSLTQYNITPNVPGTFTYFPAPGTVINARTVLSATFTPTDAANYNSKTVSTFLLVLP